MPKQLIKDLQQAEGRSEFVIVVFCDIRGFSQFSTTHESPDLAMFIKRFYLKLLQNYFKEPSFAKLTGDGLLLVFKYSETSLITVSELVLSTCFQLLKDFPTMFRDDPMINFETPSNLAFGITRGTACCLFAGNQVLDYSGQILNLAARLTDLARPRGIIIDATYIEKVIPEEFRPLFNKQSAYIKSLAEESPREILSSNEVILPSYALSPLTGHDWAIDEIKMTVSEAFKLTSNKLMIHLRNEILSPDWTKLIFSYPIINLPGYRVCKTTKDYKYTKDAKGPNIIFDIKECISDIKDAMIPPDQTVTFQFHYIPKQPETSEKQWNDP